MKSIAIIATSAISTYLALRLMGAWWNSESWPNVQWEV